jgi:hypothetical protein
VSTRAIPLSSLVFLGLLAACESSTEPSAPPDPSLSAAEVSQENFTVPIEATFDCTAAGGEIVDVSGTLHLTIIAMQKEGQFAADVVAVAGQGISGTGRSSGATYQAPGMSLVNTRVHAQPLGDNFVATVQDLTHLVRTGGGDAAGTLWGAKLSIHTVFTSSGQIIEHAFDLTDCVAL